MKYLIILNDPPYGTERSYNGLRLAKALQKREPDSEVNVFLMADAVLCAKHGQDVPGGYYNLELMLGSILRRGHVLLCGTCMSARGIRDGELIEQARRSTMDELAELTASADKVMIF